MRTTLKFTLGIASGVLFTTIAGLVVFLYFGSAIGIYALVLGIPSVIVGGSAAYARRSRPTGSLETSRYFQTKAREAGEGMRSLLDQYERLDERLDDWDDGGIDDELSYLLDQFDAAGIEFDRATNRFSVTGGGEIRELERLEAEVEELRSDLGEAAARVVEQEREACVRAQKRLRDAELIDAVDQPAAPGEIPPEDVLAVEGAYEEVVREALEEAVEALGSIAESNDLSGETVERGADTARSALERGEYSQVADVLAGTREDLQGDLSPDFDATRDALETLLDTVTSSVVDEYVRPSLIEDAETIRQELAGLDSAFELSEIEQLSKRAREHCTEMVETMSDELAVCLDTLSSAPVSDGFYEYQSANDEAYVRRLRTAEDLDEYRRGWQTAVEELSAALDAVEEKAAIVEAYPTVRGDIEEQLRATGRVEASDLSVKQPGEFMALYANENRGVAYDPETPALDADDPGESYEVTVRAGFADAGRERPITVSLEGPVEETESVETGSTDDVTFEAVPRGEYTLTVSTPEAGYETIGREVTVDDDEEFEARLEDAPLRESVCDGIEKDVRDALSDVAPLLSERYDEQEYLSDSMDLPMTDEYAPCLLVLWAEREDLTAGRSDGGVLVYDEDQLTARLSSLVENDLDSDESMSYRRIQERLSVPVSEDLLVETLRNSAVAPEIECGPRKLTKR